MKPIAGYEDNYFVDEHGIVYTKRRRGTSGGILPQRINSVGYLRVDLQKGKDKKSVLVHRLVANAYIPKVEGCDFVNHKDGNKLNNNVENLEWCNRSENMLHAYSKGLIHLDSRPCGEKHHRSKLSDEQVKEIKKLHLAGISGAEIGRQYNVSKSVIYNIIHGKRKVSIDE